MNRLYLHGVTILFFILFTNTYGADVKNIKGMWVWDIGTEIISDPVKQAELIKYSAAPHKDSTFPINRLFFEARTYNKDTEPYQLISDPLTNKDAIQLQTFLRNAHVNGLKVEYLDGQAVWVKNEFKSQPKDICSKVIAFNAKSTNVQNRFDGIHFDIEPHTLGDSWRENTSKGKDQYNDEYEDNFLEIIRDCRQQIIASRQDLTLSVDLGADYSYYVTDLWDGLAAEKTTDYITIMNYYNTLATFTNGVDGVGGVVNNLYLAKQLPMIFAAETMSDKYVPADITFWNKGFFALKSVLSTIVEQFQFVPLFNGIAVHHYHSFKAMRNGDPNPPDKRPTCIGKASGKLEIKGLSKTIQCVMRPDSYQAKIPVNGVVIFNNAANLKQVELYRQYEAPRDCSGYMKLLDCSKE